MSWQLPNVTLLGHDLLNQEIRLVTYVDAEDRAFSRIEVGGVAAIALDHLEGDLEDQLRDSLAPPRLARLRRAAP